MKKSILLKGTLSLSLLIGLFAFVSLAAASGPVHWSYSGEEGPEHWGELSEDFAACSTGTEQSPIDIPGTAPTNPADIVFNYNPTDINILNNGHTIQVNYDEGSSIEVNGTTYNLLQFHFHALSEHTVDGNYADGEMHLVHQSDAGEYAVVGVLLKRGGDDNAAFAPVWDNLPAQETEATTISGVSVNAADLLPAERTYYRYNGSFTTPPCTEGVNWFVMSTPVELSDAQLAAFEQIYSANYRPVQPLNGRTFLETASMASEPAGDIAPATLPTSGGQPFPTAALLAAFGLTLTAIGLFLRHRKNNLI